MVKENLTFRPLASSGSCCLARHYESVVCPEVKRHQQADVWATLCSVLCRLILLLLSALVRSNLFKWAVLIWIWKTRMLLLMQCLLWIKSRGFDKRQTGWPKRWRNEVTGPLCGELINDTLKNAKEWIFTSVMNASLGDYLMLCWSNKH